MENQIKTLIEIIENYKIPKINIISNHIRLEDYLDITKDKNLDYRYYSLFGYDDEEIFELDYEFMINNIY